MTALSEDEVRHVAELAHLELSPEELKKFRPQLAAILEYVQNLNALDTGRVEPMAQVTGPGSSQTSFREDAVRASLPQQVALQNAPEPDPGYFKVPSVIERE
ncbi:MAG: Asp-tRNA(Asn)/Glu-tRNA(Gln) amidotransferase subunit GatC [Terriglobia bacterium]